MLPGGHQVLPVGDQVLPGCDQEVFLAIQKGQKKCFGVAGVAKNVFWCGGTGKKSVLAWREWQKKCLVELYAVEKTCWLCQ